MHQGVDISNQLVTAVSEIKKRLFCLSRYADRMSEESVIWLTQAVSYTHLTLPTSDLV